MNTKIDLVKNTRPFLAYKLLANAGNIRRRVLVPTDAVDTFDTPLAVARDLGIKAHDGNLHHVLFLHRVALNGVEVVGRLT